MKKVIYFLFISLFIVSCNDKETKSNSEETLIDTKKISIQEIIYTKSNKYAKFFESNVDKEIAYSSSREHPLQMRDLNAHAVDITDGAVLQVKTSKEGNTALMVLINGKTIDELNAVDNDLRKARAQGSSSTDSPGVQGYYGKEVSFFITDEYIVGGTPFILDTCVKMYVPKMAEINYPRSHESLYPVCYFNRYRLQWEADSRNDVGMVVIVEWDGTILGQETTNENYVRRIDIVEDNGETIIKEEMFDDIPHLAIVRVTIVRGNIEIVDFNDSVYKLFTESNASLSTIILREEVDLRQ